MRKIIYLAFLMLVTFGYAQENVNYQKPPSEILDLVDVQRAPSVLINDSKECMVLLYRDAYKTIAELSQEELRLGGLRIDPKTNIGSRVTYFNNIKIKNIGKKNAEVSQVKGLPENPKLTNFTWSPNQKKIALTNTTNSGVEIWVLDLQTMAVKKLTEAAVNANLGDVINWFEDGNAMLVKMVSQNRKELINTKTAVPNGPTISVNDGKKLRTEPIKIC